MIESYRKQTLRWFMLGLMAAMVVAAAGWPTGAQAALISENFIGANNGDWNTAGNWSSPGVVPINGGGNTYAATIASIGNVFYDVAGSNTINTLTLTSSGLTLNSGDNLTVSSSATFSSSAITANSSAFSASGVTSFDGTSMAATGTGTIGLSGTTSFTTNNDGSNEFFTASRLLKKPCQLG